MHLLLMCPVSGAVVTGGKELNLLTGGLEFNWSAVRHVQYAALPKNRDDAARFKEVIFMLGVKSNFKCKVGSSYICMSVFLII